MYKAKSNQKDLPKNNVRWSLDWTYNGLRYRDTVICGKSQIEKAHRDFQEKILNGNHSKKNNRLFDNWTTYREYKKNEIGSSYFISSDSLWIKIKSIIKNVPLQEFDRLEVDKLKNILKNEGKKNSTVNRYISLLSDYFTWLIMNSYFEKVNPCFKHKLQENNEREIDLSYQQKEELFKLSHQQSVELNIVIMIATLTGLRQNEILKLQWSEINFERGYIKLSAERTKSRKKRQIPMHSYLLDLLKSYKQKNPFQKEVFGIYNKNSRFAFNREWNNFRDKLSFSTLENGLRFRFHDLRHVAGQVMSDSGMDLQEVQQILGHYSITTTQNRYVNINRKNIDMNKLSKVMPI